MAFFLHTLKGDSAPPSGRVSGVIEIEIAIGIEIDPKASMSAGSLYLVFWISIGIPVSSQP